MTHSPVVLVHVYACKHCNPSKNLIDKPTFHFDIAPPPPPPNPPSILTSTPPPPPRSPIEEPPWGELMLMCTFGSHAFLWSCLPSNHQGALPGPQDGCGVPNFSSSPGLIGVSPLSTPLLLVAVSQKHSFPSFVPPNYRPSNLTQIPRS